MDDQNPPKRIPQTVVLPKSGPGTTGQIYESYDPVASAAEIACVKFGPEANAPIAPACEVAITPASPGEDSSDTE